jgi:cytochrome c peroxidase
MKVLCIASIAMAASITVPLGLDRFIPAPAGNPLTPESIALGKSLFSDTRLSRNQTISCATCHDPHFAFSDPLPTAKGIQGLIGTRRSPRLANRAWGKSFFWDGRASTLEEQVLGPIANPIEMDLDPAIAAKRVGLNVRQMQTALASYVRSILSGDSPYDRFLAGDRFALDSRQQKGLALFRGKAGCSSCHPGPNLTDEEFHATGVGTDPGRFAVTHSPEDKGAFKTPSLRDAARTPPYMHNGSLATLADVIHFYNESKNSRDPEMRPLHLSPEEEAALVAFLEALNGKIRDGN